MKTHPQSKEVICYQLQVMAKSGHHQKAEAQDEQKNKL